LRPGRYPRSSDYDPEWVLALDMGPHPLWQLEDLLIGVEVAAGSRVLDLGSGMSATSVYLVREYGCEVVSLDLWVPSDERQAVLDAAGVGDHATTVTGDVRTIALGDGGVRRNHLRDAFEHFGTDTRFLPRLVAALRSGGALAMSTPALRDDPYTAGCATSRSGRLRCRRRCLALTSLVAAPLGSHRTGRRHRGSLARGRRKQLADLGKGSARRSEPDRPIARGRDARSQRRRTSRVRPGLSTEAVTAPAVGSPPDTHSNALTMPQ
jgi:hypothetical protein